MLDRNDLLIWFGGLILTWTLGLIQGWAIGRTPITRKAAAKVLAQASAKARKQRVPMSIGGIVK